MLSRSVPQQLTEEKGGRNEIQHTSKADQRRIRKESRGEKRVHSWRFSSGCRKKLTEERKCSGRSQRLITWEEPERKLQQISKADQRRTRKETSADFIGWSKKCREEKKEKRTWEEIKSARLYIAALAGQSTRNNAGDKPCRPLREGTLSQVGRYLVRSSLTTYLPRDNVHLPTRCILSSLSLRC